jgi:carbon storage regulator
MLVLCRKPGERVHVGDNVVLTVIRMDRGKVWIGFEAPREVPIYREELLPLKEPPPEQPPETPQGGLPPG